MATYSGVTNSAMMRAESAMASGTAWSGLTSDSRLVKPGYLFAALSGAHTDGARFIADAVARGATTVLGLPALAPVVEALGVRFIADEQPRRRLAELAADYFRAQPEVIAAVTGTNGKTSVSVFLRQIWQRQGHKAASLGTIGLVSPFGVQQLAHTTPDPVELHGLLAELAGKGVQHLALEASSHGLDQYRLDGVRLAAAAFTNISRDHLDYHPDFAHYLAAKCRLFRDLTPPAAPAVIYADVPYAEIVQAEARAQNLRLISIGSGNNNEIQICEAQSTPWGQHLRVKAMGRQFAVRLPLVGAFQAANALVAAGLAIGLGENEDAVFAALAELHGAPGRLEKVALAPNGAPIFVDYAHTPDALENVLRAMRPHVAGRIIVVFGCGGDRDRGKRSVMGAVAASLGDVVIVTDDNPRSEDAAKIRQEVRAGCPAALEIGDRAEAIAAAIALIKPEDVLIIAGKGHETGQLVGGEVRPFSDHEVARTSALKAGGSAVGTEAP
jgi:UDP-N-acetylmuramoyl-L-alanyl-D-glutamate--2,6-diaminopimelate ligase